MASALVSDLDNFIEYLKTDESIGLLEYGKIAEAVDIVQNAIEEHGY
jgi:hypothetical protein